MARQGPEPPLAPIRQTQNKPIAGVQIHHFPLVNLFSIGQGDSSGNSAAAPGRLLPNILAFFTSTRDAPAAVAKCPKGKAAPDV